MNKTSKLLVLTLLSSCLFTVAGCNEKAILDTENIVFRKKNVVLEKYADKIDSMYR